MLNFKDIDGLHSVLKAIYKDRPGCEGIPLFAALLQEHLRFTVDQAARYASSVLSRNSADSADCVLRNACTLVGKWSRGNSAGSAGNLLVSRTESWIFSQDLTYEHKHESYEGYVSPFGGGYSRPRSSSTFGIWAPSDRATPPIKIVIIDKDGRCMDASADWATQEGSSPGAITFNGERFGRM